MTTLMMMILPIKVVSCGSKTSDVQFEFLSPLYPEMLPNKTAQCDLTVSHNCESPICQVTTINMMQFLLFLCFGFYTIMIFSSAWTS